MLVSHKMLANTRERQKHSSIVKFPLKPECGRKYGSACFGSYSWLSAVVGMEMTSPDFLTIYHALQS